MKNARILLIEDNRKIMLGNRRMLAWEGYEVDCALNLAEARECIAQNEPDVIVLDIMLPDGNGLDFMEELRAGKGRYIPILLLTGLAGQEDMVAGLNAGGDDYLPKPYDFSVLLARTQALLRRARRVPDVVECERIKLDVLAGVAYLDDQDLLLGQKEFALLLIFAQNPGRYIDGEYLYEKLWSASATGDRNALKSAIKRLRGKLADSGWGIEWSRGYGYSFEKNLQ